MLGKFLSAFLILFWACASDRGSLTKFAVKNGCEQAANNEAQKIGHPEKIVVTYSLTKRHLSEHEPVIVNFVLRNNLDGQIKLDLGQDFKEKFALTITQPDGVQIHPPQYGRDGLSRVGEILIKPGGDFKERLLLNEWAAFNQPGTYLVDVELNNVVSSEEGESLHFSDKQSFRFDVKPSDKKELAFLAESLLKEVTSGDASFEQSSEAALALSYIDDPAAVPHIEKAILQKPVLTYILIEGLVRVADENAVEALVRLLKNNDKELSAQARSALGIMAETAADKGLKSKIEQALK